MGFIAPEEREFPQALLLRPLQERSHYFKNEVIIGHPHFETEIENLKFSILNPTRELISVIGPTGVGKTVLCEEVAKEIMKELGPEMERDKGMIALIYFKAPEYLTSQYDWDDFFFELLSTIPEILVDKKIDYEKLAGEEDLDFKLDIPPWHKIRTYVRSYKKILKHRKTRVVIIDESANFTRTAGGKKLTKYLNFWRSLATFTGVLHVLVGTYELHAVQNLNGQLLRRNKDIHLRRYRADIDTELEAFIAALYSLLRGLPLEKVPDPMPDGWAYYYERCIGCIGILKDWLLEALLLTIRRDGNELTMNILEETALSVRKCKRLLLEIADWEKALINDEDTTKELRTDLGLIKPDGANIQAEQKTSQPQKSKQIQPGRRKAVRDAVGF
ncbi:MAG: ATP-binding protein [Thermodesulfovibrionales bacterium]|jgi:hypothetical protein